MSWYVITAGPSAGKSSVVRELNARGYRIGSEGARIVIDQAVSEGNDIEEYRSTPQYQRDVIEADRRVETNIPNDDVVFLDRSLADNIAYANLTDREIPESLHDECRNRYSCVYLLEQIPFEDDYARTEDEQMAQDLHDELRSVYEHLGYTVVDVPLMPVDERADMIESDAITGPAAIH